MAKSDDVLWRDAPAPDLTLRYGPHRDHVIDVRLPPDDPYDGTRALVVVVHGGFWRARYDRTHAGPASAALAGAGHVVATVEYRRVDGSVSGWPDTFDDICAMCDALPRLLADALGKRVDGEGTVFVGHSAGAQLALWAAARHRLPADLRWHRSSAARFAGVVSLAGVIDLVRADELDLGRGAVRALLGGGWKTHPDRYAVTSPAALVPLGTPTALLHGTRDDIVPVQLSRDYYHRASAAGDPATLVELPDVGHYELIDPRSPAWPPVLEAIARVNHQDTPS